MLESWASVLGGLAPLDMESDSCRRLQRGFVEPVLERLASVELQAARLQQCGLSLVPVGSDAANSRAAVAGVLRAYTALKAALGGMVFVATHG